MPSRAWRFVPARQGYTQPAPCLALQVFKAPATPQVKLPDAPRRHEPTRVLPQTEAVDGAVSWESLPTFPNHSI